MTSFKNLSLIYYLMNVLISDLWNLVIEWIGRPQFPTLDDTRNEIFDNNSLEPLYIQFCKQHPEIYIYDVNVIYVFLCGQDGAYELKVDFYTSDTLRSSSWFYNIETEKIYTQSMDIF